MHVREQILELIPKFDAARRGVGEAPVLLIGRGGRNRKPTSEDILNSVDEQVRTLLHLDFDRCVVPPSALAAHDALKIFVRDVPWEINDQKGSLILSRGLMAIAAMGRPDLVETLIHYSRDVESVWLDEDPDYHFVPDDLIADIKDRFTYLFDDMQRGYGAEGSWKEALIAALFEEHVRHSPFRVILGKGVSHGDIQFLRQTLNERFSAGAS